MALINMFPQGGGGGGGFDPTKYTVLVNVSCSDGGVIDGQTVTVNGVGYPVSGTSDSVSIVAPVGTVLNISFNDRLAYYKPAPIVYTILPSVIVKLFDVQYRKGMILGIEYDETDSNPLLTRTYDSYGKVATVGKSLTEAARNDFDSLYPFSGIVKETVNGRAMVKIPKFYYKIWGEGDVRSKAISGTKIDETWKIHPMFLKGNVQWTGDNSDNDFNEFCWIAQYETAVTNASLPNTTVTVNTTRATFRTYAKAIGDGWSQLGIAEWLGLQLLFEIVFATHNSESIMKGNQSGAKQPTGLTTGAVSSCIQLADTAMSFYGVENMVGNVRKFVDGLNINNLIPYINTDMTKYADDSAVGVAGAVLPASAYIKTMHNYDGGNLDWVELPETAGGSETTFFCDRLWTSTGWVVAVRGALWLVSPSYGLWSWELNYDSSGASSSLGSRLSYRPY